MPSPSLVFRDLTLGFLLIGTASCTVYAPMQPTMPLLEAVGQAEGSASIQPNGRVEALAAYSPARHLLLTAGGTLCPKLGSSNFLVSRQYELGAGGYLPLGSYWLLNGIGGYGQAVNNRGYRDLGIIFGSTYSEYNARYQKLFAQVGIAHIGGNRTLGFTYRLTQARFSTLTHQELGELPLTNMLRHEVLFFARRPLGNGEHWESLVTMGMSVSGTPKRDDDQGAPSYGAAEYEANRNLLPAFYASWGVVYHPHWGNQRNGNQH